MENEIVKVNVNSSIAELFYQQCIGSYSGHMSNIPNNPVLNSICLASGANDRASFKEFLKQVAENIPDYF